MPAQPRKAAGQGRRNPALLDQGPDSGDAALDQHVRDEMDRQHHDDPTDPDTPEDALLYAGDIVTCNATLAVDVTGNGKTDFIGYRATTRVQPGEDHAEAFSRVAGVVRDGTISAADEVAAGWAEYEQIMQNQRAEALRVTGPR